MREKLIRCGHQNGGFGSVKNLVSYMEAEEVVEKFRAVFPDEEFNYE